MGDWWKKFANTTEATEFWSESGGFEENLLMMFDAVDPKEIFQELM